MKCAMCDKLTAPVCVVPGLLAGIAVRAKRPEYAQLLTDCQRVYCEVRLGLVAAITAERVAEYARDPLPSLTRSGCSYLMQVRLPVSAHAPSTSTLWRSCAAVTSSTELSYAVRCL